MTMRAGSNTAQAARAGGGILRRFPVVSYFLLAFGFTWLAVSPMLLARAGVIQAEIPVELMQIIGALAGPALAGVVVSAGAGGLREVGRLLRRVIQWRVNLVWYLVLLFGPLLGLTLTASFFFGWAFLGEFARSLPLLPTAYLPVLIVGVILGPLWEEIGWRGVTLPRLQRRLGPLAGTVILGVFWAVWHLPGYIGGWLGGFSALGFLALILASVGFSILMTWIYNHTRGSLLIARNASIAFGGGVLPSQMSPEISSLVQGGWIPGITYLVWGSIIVILSHGRLAYEGEGE